MRSSERLKRFLFGFFLAAVVLLVGWIWYEVNAEELPELDNAAAVRQFYQRHGGQTAEAARIFTAMLAGESPIKTGALCWRTYAPDAQTHKYHQQVLLQELGGMGAAAGCAVPLMSRLLEAPEWEIRLAAAGALLQLQPADGAATRALACLITTRTPVSANSPSPKAKAFATAPL